MQFRAFRFSTIVIVFIMLCITTIASLYLLVAYKDYQQVVDRSLEVQHYYESIQK